MEDISEEQKKTLIELGQKIEQVKKYEIYRVQLSF